MNPVITNDEVVSQPLTHDDDLKLLVEWSSPWHEFVTSIGPALAHSPKRLAGEARTDVTAYREMAISWAAEVVLIVLAIVIPARLAVLRPYQPPVMPKYDVIYFSGDELPQTEDRGGAKAGTAGRAGGHEAHHRTQVIRVARGEGLREKVVDAPKLDLPTSLSDVANLLAYKPIPGPAPAEGLHPSLRAPSLSDGIVAPSPQAQRDNLRRPAPSLAANIVPPSPQAQRDNFRNSAPSMSTTIVPPSPSAPVQISPARVAGDQMISVIPPPVSAPEQVTNLHPRLTLPAPSVVAPPPSTVARELRPGPGFGPGDPQRQVVPPPVQLGNISPQRNAYGRGIGNSNVVPPPVQLNGASNGRTGVASLGNPNIVAPPVQVSGSSSERSNGRGAPGVGNPTVVPPPVQVAGGGSLRGANGTGLGGRPSVVPPPPNAATTGGGLGRGSRGNGLGGPGDVGAVSAPPSTTGGNAAGSGIVVSNQPGSKVGLPGGAGTGSLALSPPGGDKPGVGSGQGGNGIGQGSGTGSGLSHDGPGASVSGKGPGSDTVARAGISPFPGTGGAGNGTVGKPPIPGVSVHGGSDVITLPASAVTATPRRTPHA
ncbi:MAG TPA: hypothetical protein VKU01_07665, partial [Bryobacteraceae bacterium]|nr:hypothetical protein [Bryobacteraceae bacterium]